MVSSQADRQLAGHAPVPPLIPRLLYADATPEALAHALATGWPSGGVLSAEAGAVFGAAIRLDAWLRSGAQANGTDRVPTKRIYRGRKMRGPNCVRDSRDLRAALAILNERGRARMEEGERRRAVAINPALLGGRE